MKFPIESSKFAIGRLALILILLVCVQFQSNGQTISSGTYPFTSSSGAALEDMSTGTTTLLGAIWDDGISPVTNIGFDFYFTGKYYNQFSINSNGLMKLNNVTNAVAVTKLSI